MTFGEKIKLFFSSVGDFLTPFIKIFLSSAGQLLAEVSLDVVKKVAVDPKCLDSAAKREAAFSQIKEQLSSKGIVLASSVIYAAIEAAVQRIKQV